MFQRNPNQPGEVRQARRRRELDWLAAAPYIDALGVAASLFGGMTVSCRDDRAE